MRYFRTTLHASAERGRADGRCCAKAEQRPCVCEYSWKCKEHGETCVGSHE